MAEIQCALWTIASINAFGSGYTILGYVTAIMAIMHLLTSIFTFDNRSHSVNE